ncbi:unnamed protein product [Calicophoron daubneyi]|uniref:Uncharacterized protein n=1 Tax=Calicophoron daubneyi TaxID=300641 RepID=A0AAV2SZX3_CALDB
MNPTDTPVLGNIEDNVRHVSGLYYQSHHLFGLSDRISVSLPFGYHSYQTKHLRLSCIPHMPYFTHRSKKLNNISRHISDPLSFFLLVNLLQVSFSWIPDHTHHHHPLLHFAR